MNARQEYYTIIFDPSRLAYNKYLCQMKAKSDLFAEKKKKIVIIKASAKDIRRLGRDSLNALEAGDTVRSSMLS